jgi:hypothetical protein
VSLWTPPPGRARVSRSHDVSDHDVEQGQVGVSDPGKSNYPVATPMDVKLTEDEVRDIAKLLETRGFPPFSDEDIGRLHLLLYDLLYEGHEDTMRLS